jgi:diguanylate cyclase (GGDEF)-like protein
MTPAHIPARLADLAARLRPGSANRRLREANETLMRILGAIDEYIYTSEFLPDGGYRLIVQGPCRAELLAMPADQARDAVWADYVHPADRELFDHVRAELVERGALDFQYRIIDATGTTRWVRDRGRIRREDGRIFLDGSVMDVTSIRVIHADLEEARARADRLARIDPLTELPNRRSLDAIVKGALEAPGGTGLLLLDVDRFKRINDSHGHAAGDAVLIEVARRLAVVSGGPHGVVRMGGEEFLVALAGLRDEHELRARAEGVRTAIRANTFEVGPFAIEVTASVGAVWTEPGADPSSNDLLAAADNALYTAKKLGRDRVRLASEPAADDVAAEAPETLALAQAIAGCVIAREGGDSYHSAEVGELAGRVARRLRCSPEGVARARLAGLVHDVGKLTIPDSVLLKPGGLDDAEWAVMRGHSASGEAIVSGIPELAALAPIVRHHHERWDGSGYPDCISTEEIPLEARIVSVVDAWSAMTSDRVYRRALEPAEALAELRRVAGTQLDPSVVEAFCVELAADSPDLLRLPADRSALASAR